MISIVDWGIWLVYFTVIFFILWFYRHSKTEAHYRFFLSGFLVKVFGGLAFVMIHLYYYGGDTILYHHGAKILSETLIEDPKTYFQLLLSENNNLPPKLGEFSKNISYSATAEEWFMVKILSFFSFISFNSYLILSLFMNLISFWGAWKLFSVFNDISPTKGKYIFFAVFLLPSVFFWSVGILKDTITLVGINYLIFILYFLIRKQKISFLSIVGFIFWSYIIYQLKSYILLAFIPSLGFILFFYFKNKIQSDLIRFVFGIFLLIFFVVVTALFLINLSAKTNYDSANLEKQIKGFHSWHTTTGGSSYDLDIKDYSALTMIKKSPAALNVTFFRPYLWESRNLLVLIGALESLFVFVLFIFMLIKANIKIFKIIRSNYFLLGLLFFVIIFAFAVGFTSYNFGALARYKMPVFSIFVFTLFYIIEKAKQLKKQSHL